MTPHAAWLYGSVVGDAAIHELFIGQTPGRISTYLVHQQLEGHIYASALRHLSTETQHCHTCLPVRFQVQYMYVPLLVPAYEVTVHLVGVAQAVLRTLLLWLPLLLLLRSLLSDMA